jgi:hypothetical protein
MHQHAHTNPPEPASFFSARARLSKEDITGRSRRQATYFHPRVPVGRYASPSLAALKRLRTDMG